MPSIFSSKSDVLHVARDAGVAADAELADAPCAFVPIERCAWRMSSPRVAVADDLARRRTRAGCPRAPGPSYTAGYSENVITPRAESLDRREEELAARHVLVPVVDLAVAAVERDREVGALADDADLGRGVEAVGVAAHPLALGVPVEQARAEDDLRELVERQAGLLGERVRRVLAADPRDLGRHRCAGRRPSRRPARARAARPGDPPPRACSRARRA